MKANLLRPISSASAHVGRVRDNNEDSLFADDKCDVYVVAEGTGDHAAGVVASRIALELGGERLEPVRGGVWRLRFDALHLTIAAPLGLSSITNRRIEILKPLTGSTGTSLVQSGIE